MKQLEANALFIKEYEQYENTHTGSGTTASVGPHQIVITLYYCYHCHSFVIIVIHYFTGLNNNDIVVGFTLHRNIHNIYFLDFLIQ